jgi:hypothetical protein
MRTTDKGFFFNILDIYFIGLKNKWNKNQHEAVNKLSPEDGGDIFLRNGGYLMDTRQLPPNIQLFLTTAL